MDGNGGGLSGGATAPRYARPFVAAFLATLVVSASAALNAWPFSNWELFSRLRTDRQSSWEETAVDASGRQHDYLIASLPRGYPRATPAAAAYSRRWTAEQDALCAAWERAGADRIGPETRLLRIYRLNWLLSDRRGHRAAAPHRTLKIVCKLRGNV
jgi:hypothetical protein